MGRTWAIIERELRRFRRSPMLIVDVDGLADRAAGRARLRLRRQRQAPEAGDRRSGSRRAGGARPRAGVGGRRPARAPSTSSTTPIRAQALDDLRNGRVNGVLTIPPDFSRRVLAKNEPRVALIEDNTDSFVSVALAGTLGGMLAAYSQPARGAARRRRSRRSTSSRSIRTCRTSSTCCRARS